MLVGCGLLFAVSSLRVVCCLLCVGCWLLCVMCDLLCDVFMFVGGCSLFVRVVCWLLVDADRCLLFVDCNVLFGVCFVLLADGGCARWVLLVVWRSVFPTASLVSKIVVHVC